MPADPGAWAYFDTSVLVKCYVTEQGTRDALSLTSRHEVLSSAIAPIQVTSTLRRQVAAGGLTRRQHDRALDRFAPIAPTGPSWRWIGRCCSGRNRSPGWRR